MSDERWGRSNNNVCKVCKVCLKGFRTDPARTVLCQRPLGISCFAAQACKSTLLLMALRCCDVISLFPHVFGIFFHPEKSKCAFPSAGLHSGSSWTAVSSQACSHFESSLYALVFLNPSNTGFLTDGEGEEKIRAPSLGVARRYATTNG